MYQIIYTQMELAQLILQSCFFFSAFKQRLNNSTEVIVVNALKSFLASFSKPFTATL